MAEHGQARATSSVARGASRGTAPPQSTPLAPGGLLDWPTPACPFTRVVADGGRHADCGRGRGGLSPRPLHDGPGCYECCVCDRPGGGRQVDLEVVRMGLRVAIPSQLESGLAGSPLGNLREAGGRTLGPKPTFGRRNPYMVLSTYPCTIHDWLPSDFSAAIQICPGKSPMDRHSDRSLKTCLA